MAATLLQNAIWIPEADLYLRSVHRHDYIPWKSEDGIVDFAIDGGQGPGSYIRRVGTTGGRVVEWCLTDADPFELVAERLLWGTFGKDGKGPMKWRPIATLETNHLRAILRTQPHIRDTITERVVSYWLAHREAVEAVDAVGVKLNGGKPAAKARRRISFGQPNRTSYGGKATP